MSDIKKPEEWGHETTGPMRKVVHEELEAKLNGTLDRLEKGQRWMKTVGFFFGAILSVVSGVVFIDRYVQSLAKKSELDELSAQMSVIGAAIQEIKFELKKTRVHGPWEEP